MKFALLLAATLSLPALADDPMTSTAPVAANPTTAPVPGAAYGANEASGACQADVQALCPTVQPGGGRILACLRDNRSAVSDACKASLAHMQRHRRAAATTTH